MRQMMQWFFISWRRRFVSAINNFWIERDQADPRHAFFVLGHHADGFIFVAVNLETLFGRQKKKREHVAARNGCDKSLFRVNVRRIGKWHRDDGRRSRCRNDDAAVKRPGVFPRIFTLEKIGTRSLPFDGRFVFGHGFSNNYFITCGSCHSWPLCASRSSAAIGPQVPAA